MTTQTSTRLFTAQEYERMGEAGILGEDERVELLAGEIVEMSPIGKRHNASVMALDALLQQFFRASAHIGVQGPIHLDEISEPQPDLMVLRPRSDSYFDALPGPADVLLLIEVADRSLEDDRGRKLPLYAAAGIPEVWLVNLRDDLIEVFSRPIGETYQEARQVARGGTVTAITIPGLTIPADRILGRKSQ